MTTDGKSRAKGAELPSWWMIKVRELVDERKQTIGESLGALGAELARAVGRARAWDHSSVSRFLNENVTTVPMAEAFAALFGIPKPIFVPRTFDEALSLQQVARRYDGKHLNTEQMRRLKTVDQIISAAEDEANDQTPGVPSRGEAVPRGRGAEGADRGRRAGRATRRRPPAS